MSRASRNSQSAVAPRKRRTTLTLPVEALGQAERIARAKNQNLSAVVAEALVSGLRLQNAAQRSAQILRDYQQAFRGFTAEELLILDGVIPRSEAEK